MGMYTELVLKCRVKDDAPQAVKEILNHLFNDMDLPERSQLPDHPFFSCDRWMWIGRCSSYYHVPFALSRYAEGYIFSRSDLKNYDDEIDKFIDWIRPYLDVEEWREVIGWSWYEEAESPTLIRASK